ncbi:SIR2 family protein [Candidatus Poriferisodalis sp.]|uniref:SIR2 family protein n=1 Tax=Candidatus Poriferisodalis sp. TaxID=3101277 RepID=UPI003B029F4B
MDDYEFAILVYSNGPLDARAEEAAWNLIMQRIHGSQRAIPQTLILAIESGIDIATHCQPETGFRYAIEHGQLVRRRGKQHLRQATAQIAEQCRSSPVVLLLGAGFSVSSRLPLGDELRDNAIMRLLNDPSLESLDSIDLGVEFHTWLSELSSTPEWISREELLMDPREFASGLTLERVLVVEEQFRPELPTLQEFKDRHDEIVDSPGPSVVHLAKILESWDAKLIVAQLNFDCLLERNTSAPLKPFISDEEFGDAVSYIERYCNGDEDSVPLLKLHGTIDEIETCVATQDQTNRGLATTKFRTLISLLDLSQSPLPWIYIGASMRDRDLLQTLNGQQFAKGLDEQWVIPYIVRSLKKFGDEREPHWKDSGLRGLEPRVITETSDAFFEMLAESEF